MSFISQFKPIISLLDPKTPIEGVTGLNVWEDLKGLEAPPMKSAGATDEGDSKAVRTAHARTGGARRD